MTTLKKYDLKGKETGLVELDDKFLDVEANGQMIKDYIIALRANARQWSANTKGRSEVNHTGKKPHRQKGLGRARQGCLAAPQYKGGGRVFGPKPKFDQHVRINKKERRNAIRFLLAEKIKANRVHVLEDTGLDAPKTRAVADFLKKLNLKTRVLFLLEGNQQTIEVAGATTTVSAPVEQHDNFNKSIRNLQRIESVLAANMNGYDLMLAQDVVITEAALAEFKIREEKR